MGSLVVKMQEDKITKNKVRRFTDSDGHNIYLQPEEWSELGKPVHVKVTVENDDE